MTLAPGDQRSVCFWDARLLADRTGRTLPDDCDVRSLNLTVGRWWRERANAEFLVQLLDPSGRVLAQVAVPWAYRP